LICVIVTTVRCFHVVMRKWEHYIFVLLLGERDNRKCRSICASGAAIVNALVIILSLQPRASDTFGERVTAKSITYGVTLSLLQPRAYLTDSTKTNAHAHNQRKRKCWQRRENTCSLSLCGRCNGQLRISAAHSGPCTQFMQLSLLQVLMKLNLFLNVLFYYYYFSSQNSLILKWYVSNNEY